MSGLPHAHPGGQWPAWHVNTWDSGYLDSLDYQWDEVAVPFWKEIDALARENGVKVAIEMHPQNLVFNPPTLKRLVEKTGATNVGAEMDPSHLFWQGIDPIAAIDWLGPLVFHAAAKDTRINENCKIYGVLDERFTRIPLVQNPTGLGGKHVVNKWPEDSAWDFVAVGRGHDVDFWTRFLQAPCSGSTRTWPSTSSTRTSNSASSKACRSPPRPSEPPTLQTLPPSDRPCSAPVSG